MDTVGGRAPRGTIAIVDHGINRNYLFKDSHHDACSQRNPVRIDDTLRQDEASIDMEGLRILVIGIVRTGVQVPVDGRFNLAVLSGQGSRFGQAQGFSRFGCTVDQPGDGCKRKVADQDFFRLADRKGAGTSVASRCVFGLDCESEISSRDRFAGKKSDSRQAEPSGK